MLVQSENEIQDNMHRELIFKVIAELQREVQNLKNQLSQFSNLENHEFNQLPTTINSAVAISDSKYKIVHTEKMSKNTTFDDSELVEDADFSMENTEKQAILRALQRHEGNRKLAANELKISERTLYRKIKEYEIHI